MFQTTEIRKGYTIITQNGLSFRAVSHGVSGQSRVSVREIRENGKLGSRIYRVDVKAIARVRMPDSRIDLASRAELDAEMITATGPRYEMAASPAGLGRETVAVETYALEARPAVRPRPAFGQSMMF